MWKPCRLENILLLGPSINDAGIGIDTFKENRLAKILKKNFASQLRLQNGTCLQ